MTATEAARNFSDVLSRVSAGEEIEITRGGLPVAVVSRPKARLVSAERFRELIASLPSVDDEFVHELEEIRASVGPPRSVWPS